MNPPLPLLLEHQGIRLTPLSMMTDVDDRGSKFTSPAAIAMMMVAMASLVLDVVDAQTITDTSKGEALWSWSTDGDELSDSLESPSSQNEFLLQLSSDTNWTSFLNGSNDDANDDPNWWRSPVYPSGYTPLGLVIASIFVTFIMIVIVGGNILVIIAIATERSLKGIQNWFIGSLAVADCLLGLIIMPFSLANEMMGYWVFGQWWCDVHSAVDVLLCTSSIMNLCLISLDRYWSITHAIEYLRKRTPERCVIMIAIVWILSGLVSIPPLLGWKKETPQGEFPKCELSEDIGYVLYSALGSFYIPSCIMVFVYIRIYYAARARARRSQENKIKRKLSQTKEQQLERQQNHRRVSKQQKEIQQQEELEMKPIKVTITDGKHPHVQQQSRIANNGDAVTHGDSDRPHLPTVTDYYSRGSLTNIKTFVLNNRNAIDARRHSLSTGGVDLRVMTTNWGPSLSVDRLSVVDGRANKRNVKEGFSSPSNRHKEKILHSTAPSSLTAINEFSSTAGDDSQQAGPVAMRGRTASPSAHQPVAQRPSSLKNGGDRTSLTTRHCVTFECVSADNSVSYSTVRCSVSNGEQHSDRLVREKTVDVEAESTTATESTPPAINRRTPLLCPKSRSKFEKLARRILASGIVEGGKMANTDATTENNRMNTSATYEWSSATNEDDHHLESPSPITASDVPMPLPQALIPGDVGITARDTNNHKNLRSNSNLQQDNEHEMASDGGLDPSSSDSGTLARCTVVRPLKIRFCRPNSGSVHKKSSKAKRQVIDTGRVVVREKDPARERRRISRQREKRATLILGLIMGAFIACWLPFFFLYLLAPVCPSCNIQPWGFAFAFWLGYINSALNPVIYTIFNKDFRRAFRRILFRCTVAPY